MKNLLLVTTIMGLLISTVACSSTLSPAPGQPGNLQTYRPLMHHLVRNKPSEVSRLNKLKKSDPEKHQVELNRLYESHLRIIKRVKDDNGNFTCGCSQCVSE